MNVAKVALTLILLALLIIIFFALTGLDIDHPMAAVARIIAWSIRLNRTINMIERYFESSVPPAGEFGDVEQPVLSAAADLNQSADGIMEGFRFHEYLNKVLALGTATNVYIDRTEPFKLAKAPSKSDTLGTILYTCAEAVRIALLYLHPIMPEVSVAGLSQLGLSVPEGKLSEYGAWGRNIKGSIVKKGQPLFPRKQ